MDNGQNWNSWPCGFGVAHQVRRAWKPEDLKTMMEMYITHSQPYKPPAFYSGYNELVYASADWNARLPDTIEAFWYLKASWGHQQVMEAHQRFLSKYQLTAADVPLLQFDPGDWQHPFSPPAS